jgi:hypothetical protein
MLQRFSRWNCRAWSNTDTVPSGALLLAVQCWLILSVKVASKTIEALKIVDKKQALTAITALFISELSTL